MMHNLKQLPLILLCGLGLASSAQETSRPSEPLFGNLKGWPGFADVRFQLDRRGVEFKDFVNPVPNAQYGADDLLGLTGRAPEIDMQQFILRMGLRPLDFLTLYVEGGFNQMELQSEKGSGSLIWGVGGHLNLLEHTLRGTPVQEKKELIRLSVETNFRQSETDFTPADFASGAGVAEDALRDYGDVTLEWQEIEIIPMLTYEVNRDLELSHSLTRHPGVAGHMGLVYTAVDGKFAEADFENSDEVSLLLQGDFRFASGWNSFVRLILSSDTDRRIGLGAGRNF